MPAAGAIGAVAGGALSYMGAKDQADAAASASSKQQQAMLADLAFRKQLYADFLRDYDTPLLKPLREKAAGEGPMDIGQNWAAIQRNFDTTGRNVEKALAHAGMLGSGYTPSAAAGLEMGRATALSDAYQRGIQNRDAMRLNLGAMGKTMPQQAAGVSQGYSNMAGFYGGQASQNSAAAAQSMGNAALGFQSGLQTIGENWGKWFPSQQAVPAQVAAPSQTYAAPTATQARLLDAQAYQAPQVPIIPQAKIEASVWQPTNPDSWDK